MIAARLQQAWLGRGLLARALLPLAWLFGAVLAVRRWRMRRGSMKAEPQPVPVIVVGNLIVGGAGKTPTVLALVELLQHAGYSPGIVSRGHGRHSGDGIREVSPDDSPTDCGDEPLLLRLRARVPVVVGRQRAQAVRWLLQQHPAVDVVLSDDGLQHWRLHRDLQLIVFDERGAGNGWLLPAGPLREPMPEPGSRAHVPTWVVYNAEAPSTALPGRCLRRRLGRPVALQDWWGGERSAGADWRQWQGRPLVAAAGIGHPERFFAMLRAQGLAFEALPLPDHHPWQALPWPASTADAIVSEKDAVKLRPGSAGQTRVWVAPLDFAFDAATQGELIDALERVVGRRRPAPSPAQEPDGHPIA